MWADTNRPELRGRRQERQLLDQLLRDVRAGRSRVLVVRGEAGAGKSALLQHLTAGAGAPRVARAAGVEPETEIAYAALQQLCVPLLGHLDALPEPQRRALGTAFGLAAGDPPDALLVGLAVLGLLAEAAAVQPLLCVVDDAQWLDRMSEVILTFVARRLDAESVALVFAARSPGGDRLLTGLPELRVGGLPAADARALLDSVLPGPVDERVRDRIVAETGGNPLALLELPRAWSAAELAFGPGAPTDRGDVPASGAPAGRGAALAGQVEEGFGRRIAALPAATRLLLLAAAVEPVGDVPLLWRAAARLGVGMDAAAPAVAAGLLDLGALVRFRHPLVRSAAWRAADPATLRDVHRALADVTDPDLDPDRHAWHRAHAAAGPDEDVAAELKRCADRALARGGRAAAAAFLERAAALTEDPKRRSATLLAAARARLAAGAPALVPDLLSAAELGPLDPLQQAGAQRLRAQAVLAAEPGPAAVPALLDAAGRLEGLDPAAARETYLAALGAALHAGRRGRDTARRAAQAALAVPAADDATGLLLGALATWTLEGHAAAVPALRRAVDATGDPDLLWLTAPAAHELYRADVAHRLCERAMTFARTAGALSLLPAALHLHAGTLLLMGRFGDAAAALAQGAALTGAPPAAPPSPAALLLAAYRGDEDGTLRLCHDAEDRVPGHALTARAVLGNGAGNAAAALQAARQAAAHEELAVTGAALGELVEAAARAGEPAAAAHARDRLAERATAAGTDWSLAALALADALVTPADGHFRRAVDRYTAAGLDLLTARARLLHGEWLRREGRRADARTELRAAHDAFTGMGAEAFAARAARELAATGETVRKRSEGPSQELTAQEAQIARLVVAGHTNPEIGATLFLSPRTVEWHLRKVFGKLGIASRRELAAALRDG
ncbi:AAA family ATPase [Dactylosporangium aurantiacum]|uniref:AAA family ATPase n=1 Tax=Dactylosporangium aurantiacum TaxID=35754 RepID=A0A9Q9IPB9_9ACTN|nr:LuxR family transcriptional regulator [Dactylosporangium aurantiacum]MDG6108603.1 LuxR family transcriptional regulator [Dactylosporangium aurantiacum]UWZ59176.1 AAA family ATPase [Dactylosporangium aurantiacum]